MILPVEVFEKVAHFFLLSTTDEHEYVTVLKTLSLVSLNLLERMRFIKFNALRFKDNELSVMLSHQSFRTRVRPLFLLADQTNSLPLVLSRYVKHVLLFQTDDSFMSFNKILMGPLHLNSFSLNCPKSGDCSIALDSNRIASLKKLTIDTDISLVERLPETTLRNLHSLSVSINREDDVSRLSILNPETKLSLYVSIGPNTQSIAIPVHELRINILDGGTLDCFKSYSNTLTKLETGPSSFGFQYNIDAFLSAARSLKELTILRYVFDRTSLLATLHVVKKLKDLRSVTFQDRSITYTTLITFRFTDQVLNSIEYSDGGYHASTLKRLVEELFDLKTLTANDDEMRGVAGGVKLKIIRVKRNQIRGR